jgi:hypothetical protein
MKIEYKKKAVKYINSCDKQTKQRLKKALKIYLLAMLQNYKAWNVVIA